MLRPEADAEPDDAAALGKRSWADTHTSPFEVHRVFAFRETVALATFKVLSHAQFFARRQSYENDEQKFEVFDARGVSAFRVPIKPIREITRDLGGGLHEATTWTPDRRRLDVDVEVLRNEFGPSIVAHILRISAGANRVISLTHLLHLNMMHVSENSVARERNLMFGAVSILGVFREIASVVKQLEAARISDRLTDRDSWTLLQDIRKRWEKHASRRIRDSVVSHLGDPKDTSTALDNLATKHARMVLLESDHDGRHLHARFTAGEHLLIHASGLPLADLETVIEDSLQDMDRLFNGIEGVVVDLLRQCGARVTP